MSDNQQLHRFRDRGGRFVKTRTDAPVDFFAAEAAGLRWLAEAPGGVPVCEPLLVRADRIELTKLVETVPARDYALRFGQELAHTHDAGASGWGCPPDGFHGQCYIGDRPMSTRVHETWGAFYADERVEPYLAIAEGNGGVTSVQAVRIREALDVIRAGAFDDADVPSRLHGDLWAGNVVWASNGVVLIDPAAHGGHRETDLAMLSLFGLSFLDEVIVGYQDVHPLRAGWQQRVPLHQLFPLATHSARFGPSYGRSLADAARAVLVLANDFP